MYARPQTEEYTARLRVLGRDRPVETCVNLSRQPDRQIRSFLQDFRIWDSYGTIGRTLPNDSSGECRTCCPANTDSVSERGLRILGMG